MRRSLFALSTLTALAVFVSPVDAQFKIGAHGAALTGIEEVVVSGTTGSIDSADPTYGLGARLMLDPPLFPLALVASGTYYLEDGDATYYTITGAAQLRIPLPVFKPYVTGGYQLRKSDDGSGSATSSTDNNGIMVGVGLQLDFMLSIFLEGSMEFGDDFSVQLDPLNPGSLTDLDDTPLVIKGGIIFG